MRISVIIPTYKPKEYIWECLNSLVKQTFSKSEFEVILVLNGCCEPWRGEIMDFIHANMQGMNVHFIQTDQGGVSNARNMALDVAKGEYVTFIDDDDFVSPSYLELLYEQVSPETVAICYPYAFNDGEVEKQLPYAMTDVYECNCNKVCSLSSKVRKFFSGPCMKLIPMNFIQDRRFDIRFKNGEDSLFMFLISDKIKQCRFADREAIYYRRFRENSAVTTKRSKKQIVTNQMKMMCEYTKTFLKHPLAYSLNFYFTRLLGAVKSMFFCFIFLLLTLSSSCVSAQTISPNDYGLATAASGIERYWALVKTHKEALKNHWLVDYSGIEEIHIEIPKDAVSIPLGTLTDFKGLKLYVTNCVKQLPLFTLSQDLKPINISKEDFNAGNLASYPALQKGMCLLVVHDDTPWVKERIGYNYPHIRKDVLLLENGRAQNSVIYPYTSKDSKPKFFYTTVSDNEKIVQNVEFIREEKSLYKTFFISLLNHNHVTLRNIHIKTPKSNLFGDAAISVNNCTNTRLEEIKIEGTYSQTNKYGYGVSLDNVWNTTVSHMYARANWGVFGNNNVNLTWLKNCDINRFDIHCYGKNIEFENCRITGLYNQYSSIFGSIRHRYCIFDNATPCLIEGSYNAYTPFDLIFENCIFRLNKTKNSIVSLFVLSNLKNQRTELSKKSLPNVFMKHCCIQYSLPLKEWYVFSANKEIEDLDAIEYLSKIDIDHLNLSSDEVEFKPFNINLKTRKRLKLRFKRWNYKL